MSLLGLDFGASFVKGAVLDPVSGSIKSIVRIPVPPFLEGLPPGHREIDPAALSSVFREVLDLLLASQPEPEGLVLCSQMHGFILTDDVGRPLSNYYSWQDQRVQEIDPESGRSYYSAMIERLTNSDRAALGREVRSGLPASQLFRLGRKGLFPHGARACSLADFIVAEACGQHPVTEATLASGHGLFDAGQGRWHEEVLAKLDLSLDLLPEIVPSGSRIGELTWRGRKIPCYTPIGDQQCALVGVGLRKDELSINAATGSQVSHRSETCVPGPYQVRPFFQGEFLRTITHIPAGRSLNALMKLFCEVSPRLDPAKTWKYALDEIEKITETDVRLDLSFFPSAFGFEGGAANLREENLTVGHLLLAALENMAANYRSAAERLNPDKPWKGLVLSGGLAQKIPRLRALIQRELPLPQRLPAFSEDTLLGLLILGVFWSGKHGDLAAIQSRVLRERIP